MQVQLYLETISKEELEAAIEALNAYKQKRFAQPAVAENTGSVVPVPSKQYPDPTGEPAGYKIREGEVAAALPSTVAVTPKRSKKAAQAAAEKLADPSPEIEPIQTQITIDHLRSALQRYTSDHGTPAGAELLKEFGCSRISELDSKSADIKAQFISRCPAKEAD